MQVETTETAEERLAYTAEEACALAHCSKSFLYAEIRHKTGVHFFDRPGRREAARSQCRP
jgi:hypothetical protein